MSFWKNTNIEIVKLNNEFLDTLSDLKNRSDDIREHYVLFATDISEPIIIYSLRINIIKEINSRKFYIFCSSENQY